MGSFSTSGFPFTSGTSVSESETTPFSGAGNFTPFEGEKNAREQMIAYVEKHGWLLDLTAVRSHHAWRDVQVEQDPNRFVRSSEMFPGEWFLSLDYEVRGDPEVYRETRTWDNTLRALSIWHSSWVLPTGVVQRTYVLNNYRQSHTHRSDLWDLTDRDDGKFKPLRKRAEEVLANPDLAIWLVAEKEFERDFEAKRNRALANERARRRQQPLKISISQTEFVRLGSQLRRAAGNLLGADGLTDLRQELENAEKILADIRSAILNETDHSGSTKGSEIGQHQNNRRV